MKRIGHVFERVTAFASLQAAAYRALRANRENAAALETADYLLERASRADKKNFLHAMAKVADKAPDEQDAL